MLQIKLFNQLPINRQKRGQPNKSILAKYGTSCFLQMLDEDVPPVAEDRIEIPKLERQK